MNDSHLATPLAALHGERPEAPEWFSRALRREPARRFVDVEGAKIETLIWEPTGVSTKPALLLLHGNGAHADWWSFIAPFLAEQRRVVALSWSGMGGSDWRPSYSSPLFESEAIAVARGTALYENGPPILVGHSFGGRIAVALAATHSELFRAAVIVDPPVFAPDRPKASGPWDRELRPHRVYPTFAEAMARFRFAPPQACANLFIVDHIARGSLRAAPEGGGWTWRFDPYLWRDLTPGDTPALVRAVKRPVALVRGGVSKLMRAKDAAFMRSLLPEGSPYFEIPEADHHVMIDQPLAFVAGLEALLTSWPAA
jgi:pimeloyl-ACP methyl ester carboxylesterase